MNTSTILLTSAILAIGISVIVILILQKKYKESQEDNWKLLEDNFDLRKRIEDLEKGIKNDK